MNMKAALKRFFKTVEVVRLADGYAVHLDARELQTPLQNRLLLPVRPLAEAIAGEWRSQDETIDPSSMPMGGYANTAIDRVGPGRRAVMDNMLAFAATDLLCYRADAPPDLAERQRLLWQPVLDWAERTMGARLNVTTGILPVQQPAESMVVLAEKLESLDDMELTAVAGIAPACGSLVIALALEENHLDAERAFDISQLDRAYQNERWGADSEAAAGTKKLQEDISSAARFLSVIRH